MTDELRPLQPSVDEMTRAFAQVTEQLRQLRPFLQVEEQLRQTLAIEADLKRAFAEVAECAVQISEFQRTQEVFAQINAQWRKDVQALRFWQETSMQALGQGGWLPPNYASAAGFAEAHFSALGVGVATTEDSESFQTVPVTLAAHAHVVATATTTLTAAPKAERARIALPPGVRLDRVLKFVFPPRMYKSIFYPLIADARLEHIEAFALKRSTRWIEIRLRWYVVQTLIRVFAEWFLHLRG